MAGRTRHDHQSGYRLPSPRLLIVLGALSAFGPLSMDLYLPALPELAADYDSTAAIAQLTVTSCMIGLAAGQLVVGPLSDTFGRRRPLLLGVALYTVMSLLCTIAPSMAVLIGLRAVQGIAGGAGIVIARAVVRDLCAGDAAARVFSLLMLVTGVAPVVAPVLGGQLLRIGPWQGTFVTLSLIGCVLLAAAAWAVRETLPADRRIDGGVRSALTQIAAALRDPRFLAATVVLALSSTVLFSYITMSPFVLQTRYGLSPQAFSLVFAANSIGLFAAGLTSARLVRVIGARTTLRVGLVVSAVGGIGLTIAGLLGAGLGVTLPVLFLTVASVALIMPNATAIGLTDQGSRSGTASGVMGMAQFAIGGVIPPIVSTAGATILTMSLSMLTAATVALTLCLLLLRLPHSAPTTPDNDDRIHQTARRAPDQAP
jgi:DHA1 family bicyclomycin/chloramphenicol resistance-like MFS transporter